MHIYTHPLILQTHLDMNICTHALQFIVIPHPEELRGGGLLKFSALLARGYRLPPYTTWDDRVRLESYMCNRFLIDFPSIAVQVSIISRVARISLCTCSRKP